MDNQGQKRLKDNQPSPLFRQSPQSLLPYADTVIHASAPQVVRGHSLSQ